MLLSLAIYCAVLMHGSKPTVVPTNTFTAIPTISDVHGPASGCELVGMGTIPVPHRPDGSVLQLLYLCR